MQASPVTGRVLVHHAASADRAEVGRAVRRTVSTAVHQARARAAGRPVAEADLLGATAAVAALGAWLRHQRSR
ncbi:hypothetical protein ACPZ19_41135 [Amycolatopsis lurida]